MSIILQNKSGVAGLFQIEMHTADEAGNEIPGTRHVVAPWQDNLVTDSGLDNMALANFMVRCRIGSGNSAPSEGDTQLQAQIAEVTGSVVQGPADADEGFNSIVGTYVFGQGVGSGIIAELGVSPASGNITTRAQIKDSEGLPTTITKGPMDVLTVTYQMREYPDQTDTITTIVNPHTSVEYDVVSRGIAGTEPSRMHGWHVSGAFTPNTNSGATSAHPYLGNGPLLPWTAAKPQGVFTGGTDIPYVPGSFHKDLSYTWGESAGNVAGGITLVAVGSTSATSSFGPAGWIQASFNPPIDKGNTKTLIITLRKSWGRHTP